MESPKMLLVWTGLALGCAEKEPRPDLYDCGAEGCVTTSPGVGADGTAGAVGDGGSAGTAADADEPVTIETRRVSAPTFALADGALVPGEVDVTFLGPDGEWLQATGSATLELAGLAHGSATWLSVSPNATDLYPGVALVDLSTSAVAEVAVVSKSELATIAFGLTSPVVLDERAAQLVLRFVDSSQEPVAGVSVSMTGAEADAYDMLGSFSDEQGETGPNGVFLAFNVPAVTVPGNSALVRLGGSAGADLNLALQAGAVTVAEVVVKE
jgi:hypothetical protein